MKRFDRKAVFKKIVIAITILSITTLIGCSKEDKASQNLIVALQHGITTLDPAYLRLLNEQYIACNIWEGLVRKNVDGLIEPGIAKSWEVSPDGLKYTFHLRKNAMWSDGKPVTAYDFEYAWKRALDPNKDSAVVFMMYFLKNGQAYNNNKAERDDVGVKALDDHTLEVILENPTPFFLEILNYHTYFPVRQDIVEKDPDSWHRKPHTFVSNGPFYLEKLYDNKKIVTLKNPHYWDKDNVHLNSITYLIERIDEKEIWTRYTEEILSNKSPEESTIDFGYVFPSEVNIADEIDSKRFNVIADNSLTTVYLCINSQNKPLDDIRVRQALELALNRNYIVEEGKMNEEVATGFVPPGIPDLELGSDFRIKGGEYMHKEFSSDNVSKAKTLLKEAGYTDLSQFPTISILARSLGIAEYIEDSWEANLGINVEIDVCKDALYSQKKNLQEFDIVINSWIADFADPINFLGFLASEDDFKGILPLQYYTLIKKAGASMTIL